MVKNVTELNPFIMGIVGIAVILAIGLIVLQQLGTGIEESITASSVDNESVTWTNATAVTLTTQTCLSGLSCTAYNDTAQANAITAGNYSCSGQAITYTNEGTFYNVSHTTGTLYLDYSCKVATDAYTANTSLITKLATVPTWLGIIIIIVLALLVLGYFYKRQ